MSEANKSTVVFEGEDANAGYASPTLDLIATAFLLCLSLAVLIASLRLPVPGGFATAPGLLPFLTAGSLAIMAVLLGLSAVARRRSGRHTGTSVWESETSDRHALGRSATLAIAVALYIGALQGLAFQYYFTIATIPMVLSAFEPVTILILVGIIHLYWRGALWVTALVSIGWTLTLSVIFQKLFNIPLPGGF